MTNKGPRQLLGGLAAVFLLAACAPTDQPANAGPAAPGSPENTISATTTASSPPTPPARQLPPRPRDLDLTGVDPCRDVLTDAQLHDLAYDLGYWRQPVPNHLATDHGRTCTYSSSMALDQPSRNIGSLVVVVLSAGAEVWLTDPARKTSADLAYPTTVAGFPALVMPHPFIVDNCSVVVDIHAGQYLEVASSPSGGTRGTSSTPYCIEAHRVAGLAVVTLTSAGR